MVEKWRKDLMAKLFWILQAHTNKISRIRRSTFLMSFNFGQNIPVGSVFSEIMIRFSWPSRTHIFVQEICQEDRNLKNTINHKISSPKHIQRIDPYFSPLVCERPLFCGVLGLRKCKIKNFVHIIRKLLIVFLLFPQIF